MDRRKLFRTGRSTELFSGYGGSGQADSRELFSTAPWPKLFSSLGRPGWMDRRKLFCTPSCSRVLVAPAEWIAGSCSQLLYPPGLQMIDQLIPGGPDLALEHRVGQGVKVRSQAFLKPHRKKLFTCRVRGLSRHRIQLGVHGERVHVKSCVKPSFNLYTKPEIAAKWKKQIRCTNGSPAGITDGFDVASGAILGTAAFTLFCLGCGLISAPTLLLTNVMSP